jgi:hypothetical protein
MIGSWTYEEQIVEIRGLGDREPKRDTWKLREDAGHRLFKNSRHADHPGHMTSYRRATTGKVLGERILAG